MNCRHCSHELTIRMVDLGAAPPSNAFNASEDVPESHYPLRVMVCPACKLAQTDVGRFPPNYDELFTQQYPYFSSTSPSWVAHARQFVEMATERFALGPNSLTIEVGANDGYLLQFVKTPCYGVEPTRTGDVAKAKGITIYPQFFSAEWATNAAAMPLMATGSSKSQEAEFIDGRADLMIANNVLAHVPDIDDFVKGFAILLKPGGVAVFEFPHLLNLVLQAQFDTIYHEHYSYLSLTAVREIFAYNGLSIFDVERIPTHGGSLRIYAAPIIMHRTIEASVASVLADEASAGMATDGFYCDFQGVADRVKNDFMAFLLQAKAMGATVAGFGAAAKGNTLLNYAGVRADLLPYVVDETPAKQGKFLPGSRIPVQGAFTTKPDYVVVFPWNFRAEIMEKLAYIREWGGKFVFAVPRLEIV